MEQPFRNKHYVGIPDPRLVYVILEDRTEFDKIGIEATDHGANAAGNGGHVLSKAVSENGVRVIFQHWLADPALTARKEGQGGGA